MNRPCKLTIETDPEAMGRMVRGTHALPTLPDMGHIHAATDGTAVVLSWAVEMPDGTHSGVQTTTTVALLRRLVDHAERNGRATSPLRIAQ